MNLLSHLGKSSTMNRVHQDPGSAKRIAEISRPRESSPLRPSRRRMKAKSNKATTPASDFLRRSAASLSAAAPQSSTPKAWMLSGAPTSGVSSSIKNTIAVKRTEIGIFSTCTGFLAGQAASNTNRTSRIHSRAPRRALDLNDVKGFSSRPSTYCVSMKAAASLAGYRRLFLKGALWPYYRLLP